METLTKWLTPINTLIIIAVLVVTFAGGDDGQNRFAGQSRISGIEITSDGLLVSGGNAVISTSNTATSSLEVGCVDTYATSTETPVRLSATTTGQESAQFVFGTCSEL